MTYIKSDTDFGKSVLKNVNSNGSKIIVDSIVLSQTKLDPNNLSSTTLASLPNSQVFPIVDIKSDSNYYYAIFLVDNGKINDSQFIANALALVAHSNGDNSKDIIIAVIDNDPIVLHPFFNGFQQETVTFKMSVPIDISKTVNDNTTNSGNNSNSNTSVDSALFNSLSNANSAYNGQNEYDKTIINNKIATSSKQADTIFNQLNADNVVNQSNISANSAVAKSYFNQNSTDISNLRSYVDEQVSSLANKK